MTVMIYHCFRMTWTYWEHIFATGCGSPLPQGPVKRGSDEGGREKRAADGPQKISPIPIRKSHNMDVKYMFYPSKVITCHNHDLKKTSHYHPILSH